MIQTGRLLWYESDAIVFIWNGATDKKIWSKEVWIWIWTNFEIWKFQKVDMIGSQDRWDQDETLGVGFI